MNIFEKSIKAEMVEECTSIQDTRCLLHSENFQFFIAGYPLSCKKNVHISSCLERGELSNDFGVIYRDSRIP